VRRIVLSVLLCCLGLCGCRVIEYVTPEGPPHNKQISEGYYRIELKRSSAADVLTEIYMPEYELLSQSKSVVASSGEKKKGYKRWFNMAAFDEDYSRATRKYLFIEDEKPKVLSMEPREGFSFDCEMVLESKILDTPYSNENARRIAILKQVQKNVRKDISEVSTDNQVYVTSGAMINQALETILVELNKSPALAARLSDSSGVEFSHTSYNKGRIQMVINDNVVTVKMRLGTFVRGFEKQP